MTVSGGSVVPLFDQWAALMAALRNPSPTSRREELVLLALGLSADMAPGTVGSSLTEIDGAGYRTPAMSTPLALELDYAQYGAQTGPCISAVRDRQVQRVDATATDERWPAFAAAAREHGVLSSLSYPVSGTPRPTALNVYSSEPAAFDSARSTAVAQLLAHCISVLSPADYGARARTDTEDSQARSARAQGQRVGEAVEELMRRREISRSQAFAELALRSRSEQSKIVVSAERELREAGTHDDTR
jgi:hypothetical protein